MDHGVSLRDRGGGCGEMDVHGCRAPHTAGGGRSRFRLRAARGVPGDILIAAAARGRRPDGRDTPQNSKAGWRAKPGSVGTEAFMITLPETPVPERV